jgi:hypothetical protein
MPTQPETIDERLRAGDKALLHIRGHPITVNEAHAALIGGTLAFFYGERGIAARTVTHEPWYALGMAVIGYALGRAISPSSS